MLGLTARHCVDVMWACGARVVPQSEQEVDEVARLQLKCRLKQNLIIPENRETGEC